MKTGVYSIILDKTIYIGSTNNNFRKRFIQHISKKNPLKHTYNLLIKGGIFTTLWIANDDTNESEIRKKENEYIKYYKNLSDWDLINTRYPHKQKGKHNKIKPKQKIKYKNIKINSNDYNSVIQLLKVNNIETYN